LSGAKTGGLTSHNCSPHPFHLLLAALAHWVNREQSEIIDCLREENGVLRDRLGSNRIRFTDAERRRSVQKLDYRVKFRGSIDWAR